MWKNPVKNQLGTSVFGASQWVKISLTMENSDFQEESLSVGGWRGGVHGPNDLRTVTAWHKCVG